MQFAPDFSVPVVNNSFDFTGGENGSKQGTFNGFCSGATRDLRELGETPYQSHNYKIMVTDQEGKKTPAIGNPPVSEQRWSHPAGDSA